MPMPVWWPLQPGLGRCSHLGNPTENILPGRARITVCHSLCLTNKLECTMPLPNQPLNTMTPSPKPETTTRDQATQARDPAAPCIWDRAWVGTCGQPSVKNGCCEEHQAVCCSCGAPATHECSETGQFVCGASLCDDCEHTLHEDGTNGGVGFNMQKPPEGMKAHCRKSEQRYQPWYTRMESSSTPRGDRS